MPRTPAPRSARSRLAGRCSPPWTAIDRGALAEAEALAVAAASRAPLSPRPWLVYAGRLRASGRVPEAIAAYQRADERAARYGESAIAGLALPRLLRQAGRDEEADEALRAARVFSWRNDPWLALEAAWRALPAPRTDAITVGGDDFGAVRGFYHPRPAPRPRAGMAGSWRSAASARPSSVDARPCLASPDARDRGR